ncbi:MULTISPECIES: flavin monoamine oxidase family protein [Nostoc]|uniref:FAD-dependent oxidoreductase n=2 Tax=Nostoc TaxID=1177 RepID=A0ABR8IKA9_9NOSO|nr:MULTISPECIES: NAD(P)/FAD-dependent oxidoreductase [Nostoc]MBD2565960.1 FAD-dependent oxidoreductase [Nostoc linckia FACHB-391]MBD2651613.1 FAD-dependent oxidoreductase [Nostoc foliaceum FACHB-393]
MSRSSVFRRLAHTLGIVSYCQKHNISTSEGIERIYKFEKLMSLRKTKRRQFLTDLGKMAILGGTVGVGSGYFHRTLAAPSSMDAKIAIVGAGLAGLACGYELQRQGIKATIYESSNRAGGRCYSLNDVFPGQVAERGGEFIDNLHKTMLGYVNEFKLEVEDLSKQPGEVFYYFNGQRYQESAVIDEFRDLLTAMRVDLRTLTEPTVDNFNASEQLLDFTNLQYYLDSRGAGALVKNVIKSAYIAEYGREIDQQSCLSFLLFIHADRRSKFRPFGVFSDERYHVIGGNQQIIEGLKNRLLEQIQYDKKLIAARKDSSGKIELIFNNGLSKKFDAVVFCVPFSTLRQVDLKGLKLPQWKLNAINNLVYGTNSKLMVGFNSRPWIPLGSNGSAYADLPNLQAIWETNPSKATYNRAVLTDYAGGNLGARLNPNNLQWESAKFINDLKFVFPGADISAVRLKNSEYLAYLENWSLNPLTKGSYTCNQPGYFTTIAGNEGKSVDNVYFAGEHTNSFYEWQGFMEGAAISGVNAAKQILKR